MLIAENFNDNFCVIFQIFFFKSKKEKLRFSLKNLNHFEKKKLKTKMQKIFLWIWVSERGKFLLIIRIVVIFFIMFLIVLIIFFAKTTCFFAIFSISCAIFRIRSVFAFVFAIFRICVDTRNVVVPDPIVQSVGRSSRSWSGACGVRSEKFHMKFYTNFPIELRIVATAAGAAGAACAYANCSPEKITKDIRDSPIFMLRFQIDHFSIKFFWVSNKNIDKSQKLQPICFPTMNSQQKNDEFLSI